MDRNQENLNLAMLINNESSQGEAQADALILQIDVSFEGVQNTRGIIGSFISSYKEKAPDLSNKEWLYKEFSKYPEIWVDEDELKQTAGEIVEQVDLFDSSRQDLAEHHNKGLSTNYWLAKKIEQGASASFLSRSL